MIAPILLPLFSLFALIATSPTPVVEWEVVARTPSTCTIELSVATTGHTDLSKLSLIPRETSTHLTTTLLDCDKHWINNNAHHWMWKSDPNLLHVTFDLSWNERARTSDAPLLDIAWEQMAEGHRQRWTLASVILPNLTQGTPLAQDAVASRKVSLMEANVAEVSIHVDGVQPGSFVKITEYIPPHCTCEVTEAARASLRTDDNAQIFLWFQAPEDSTLAPSYRIQCAHRLDQASFSGELEVAFGTRTKTSDIASVEWGGSDSPSNENMELNPSSDSQSVAVTGATAHVTQPDTTPASGVMYSVQLLANHRDLTAQDVDAAIGYEGPYSIVRHEGWHKYLTPEVATYQDAHEIRSNVWTNTKATDAFVTASLEGARISVQEALLVSNQTWIP